MAILGPNGQEIDPATMNPTTMDTLPPDAFAGATAADLAAMPCLLYTSPSPRDRG